MVVAIILLGSILGWSVYALVVNRRALAEEERVRTLIEAARATRIADAPAGEPIVVTGRASAKDSVVIQAPFTGGDALWARARLQTNVGQVVREWVDFADAIVVDDGSGTPAIVSLRGAKVDVADASIHAAEHRQRIAEYLAARGNPSTSDHFNYESVLRPGDTVSVLGVGRARGGYRDSANALEIAAEDGAVVVFDPDRAARQPSVRRKYIGCAWMAIVVSAIALLVTMWFAR